MICPNCTSEQPDWADNCLECGARLAFLRRHPARVGFAIWACMIIGLGLLIALLTRLLDQWLAGAPPALGWRDSGQLALGILFSLLGARAWATLRDALIRRLPSRARR